MRGDGRGFFSPPYSASAAVRGLPGAPVPLPRPRLGVAEAGLSLGGHGVRLGIELEHVCHELLGGRREVRRRVADHVEGPHQAHVLDRHPDHKAELDLLLDRGGADKRGAEVILHRVLDGFHRVELHDDAQVCPLDAAALKGLCLGGLHRGALAHGEEPEAVELVLCDGLAGGKGVLRRDDEHELVRRVRAHVQLVAQVLGDVAPDERDVDRSGLDGGAYLAAGLDLQIHSNHRVARSEHAYETRHDVGARGLARPEEDLPGVPSRHLLHHLHGIVEQPDDALGVVVQHQPGLRQLHTRALVAADHELHPELLPERLHPVGQRRGCILVVPGRTGKAPEMGRGLEELDLGE
mmetsp:Transcript_42446/g.100728  ORF Transcript_42446/g.100728 Transcript_42446/m.100728 type:complete len:351 (-) Transcript_42446:1910-2962(-)